MDIEKKEFENREYNPFEHRVIKKPNSDIRSLINLLKGSLGSGILAVPLAFANGGWAMGIVGTIIIAFVCGHCIYIFVKTSRECCKRVQKPLLGYAETCQVVFATGPKRLRPFAKAARIFADFSMIFTYVGACCIFNVLIADSLKQLLDQFAPGFVIRVEYYSLIIMIPLIFMVQIRYLKWLAPFSAIANILLTLTFLICCFYIFKDEITISDKRVIGLPSRFPIFLSTIIFAMEGIGMIMPVENNMQKPEHFLGRKGILVISMAFVTVLYTTLGVFGYLRYGDALRGSVTLNLPINEWPAICAKGFITISILLTYPLHFYIVFEGFSRYIEPLIKEEHRNLAQIMSRIFVVIFCGCIGAILPMLEQIINIVGSIFYSILGLILPGTVETIARWNNLGKFNWILWKNIVIILFGFGFLSSGLTVTIMDIVKILNKEMT